MPGPDGLNDREPDLCGTAPLRGLIGQPAGNLRTVRLKGPVRIVAPGGIVSQDEYDSTRINAYIDGEGRITRLTCG